MQIIARLDTKRRGASLRGRAYHRGSDTAYCRRFRHHEDRMEPIASIKAVAGVIQLAVAPVFLLAGIAGLLGVLSTRLGRIIDRTRVVEAKLPRVAEHEQRSALRAETVVLWERMRLVNWAIRLCVGGALTICVTIVTLFVGDFVEFNISAAIALLFVIALLLVIAGLVFFLREIGVATRSLREGVATVLDADRDRGEV
jgi:hypothetical protein